jgi:hypothetical protein
MIRVAVCVNLSEVVLLDVVEESTITLHFRCGQLLILRGGAALTDHPRL